MSSFHEMPLYVVLVPLPDLIRFPLICAKRCSVDENQRAQMIRAYKMPVVLVEVADNLVQYYLRILHAS